MNQPSTPTTEDLITALGGPVAVSRLLNEKGHQISSQAVSTWKSSGIPKNRVADIALALGRVLRSASDLEPANWPRLFPELQSAAKAD